MAKFIIVLCAVIATASAGPGLVGPLGGVPLAYAQSVPYSSPLAYSASLGYTSPVAYGLASSGSSRVDIQNNYNIAPQYAVPFAARIASPYTAAAAVQAPLAPAPLGYNIAQLVAPQAAPQAVPIAFGARFAAAPVAAAPLAKYATPVSVPFAAPQVAPVAFGARFAAAPVAAAPLAKYATPVPVPFAAPQFIPAPLRYNAPLLSNYNAAATAFYGSQLPYAFSGHQINTLPFAAPLTAAPGVPIAGQFGTSIVQLDADVSTAQTTRMTAVPAENPQDDSEEVPAKLVSESPATDDEDQKFATPAPVDQPQTGRDASSASQSPVAPLMRSDNNNN